MIFDSGATVSLRVGLVADASIRDVYDRSQLRNCSVYRKAHAVINSRFFVVAFLFASQLTSAWTVADAQTREEKVRADREKVVADGFWIYNDLPAGIAEARKTGKPILVVLRCIPCEECVKLDDELVDTDPVIRPLLEKFVCVRQVSTNGLDLHTFQYDTDQSFAVFMLNADGTVYGRFGTRSHRTEWFGDVSLEGLAKALAAGLKLHEAYPQNRAALEGKRGEPLEFDSPENYPSLKDKFTDTLNYEGNVVQSCIHCHQIGDARREYYWHARKPIPEKLLYPYPHPKAVGLILDPDETSEVSSIVADSHAAAAGLREGDRIETLNGQPILSIADVQWVLHNTDPDGGTVAMQVLRGDRRLSMELSLPEGWRRADDISWRVSTWPLRRMVLGGMVLEDSTEDQNREANDGLLVKRVGQYGAHAAAKRAGFREGDVILSYSGKSGFESEAELLTYAVNEHRVGDRVEIEVRREGGTKRLTLPIQE